MHKSKTAAPGQEAAVELERSGLGYLVRIGRDTLETLLLGMLRLMLGRKCIVSVAHLTPDAVTSGSLRVHPGSAHVDDGSATMAAGVHCCLLFVHGSKLL